MLVATQALTREFSPRKPAEGLALVTKLEEAAWGCVRDQLLADGRAQEAAAHYRLALEIGAPVYQDLNGPQMAGDWMLTLGYQKAF